MAAQHYLSTLFEPSTIAIFGASTREDSVAALVLNNIKSAGYAGKIFPINPKYTRLGSLKCYASLEQVKTLPELAIIATPAKTVPAIMESCGKSGVKTAIVLSAGFREAGEEGKRLEQSIVDIARRYDIRFVGPNCLGLIRPEIGLNATFAKGLVKKGNLALVSQSGALCTAILDWAEPRGIGFSAVVSLGISVDIDFGEILDYLVADPKTHSILLYIEGINNARAFMSGLRAAARVKPVIVVKAGRHQAGIKAAISHTGALIGADDVFDAALRRAGVVRGMHVGDLFAAATVLAHGINIHGDKLAIITNGGGPAAMACDKASDLNIPLADLTNETIESLNQLLPPMWSHGNPIDVLGDADEDRYAKATELVLKDNNTNGILLMLTPQAMTKPLAVARRIVDLKSQSLKPVITCWMGDKQVREARDLFSSSGIPTFRLPETAIQGFSYLTDFHRNQMLLLQTPGPLSDEKKPDIDGAQLIIDNALAERRLVLSEAESKAVLAAFHIPVVQTVNAHSANDAVVAAQSMGFPVVMKINSKQITHKSDVGGVILNITSAAAVQNCFNQLITSAKSQRPDADIEGVVVEPMVSSSDGRELLVGIVRDPVFGPVITFGSGGTAVELLADRAVALPPLNSLLIRDMISRTKAAKMLASYRKMPAVNIQAVENILLRISEMACELPAIKELDINPLLADSRGVVAVDARIVVDRYYSDARRYSHTAIHPYPTHLQSSCILPGGVECTIRPIRPEDAEMEQEFVMGLSSKTRHFRFMNTMKHLTPEMLARFTQIDYDREMAFVAVISQANNQQESKHREIGVCRYIINNDGETCEFAIVVADDWQGKGLAHKLMESLLESARYRGLKEMVGDVLSDNTAMQNLAKKSGFSVKANPEDATTVIIRKKL